jgi:hypothetical protein
MVPVAIVEQMTKRSPFGRPRKRIDALLGRTRKRMRKAGARWKRYFEEAW